jgi:hypothetical protein
MSTCYSDLYLCYDNLMFNVNIQIIRSFMYPVKSVYNSHSDIYKQFRNLRKIQGCLLTIGVLDSYNRKWFPFNDHFLTFDMLYIKIVACFHVLKDHTRIFILQKVIIKWESVCLQITVVKLFRFKMSRMNDIMTSIFVICMKPKGSKRYSQNLITLSMSWWRWTIVLILITLFRNRKGFNILLFLV